MFQYSENHIKQMLINYYPPIIIGGCGRSGTTLLLSILSAHPKIFAIPFETKVFCPRNTNNGFSKNQDFIVKETFEFLELNNVFSNNLYWCEKTPKNIHFFQEITSFFNSNVKLIHLVRDGRDVITSRHPFDKTKFWVTKERWIKDVKEGVTNENLENLITIRYEDIILNFEQTICKLLQFIGVENDIKIQNWHKFTNLRINPAIEGPIKDLYQSSIRRWEKTEYNDIIKAFMSDNEAINLLKHFNYIE